MSLAEPPSLSHPAPLSRLTAPKEETYFIFALLVSIAVWLALAVSVIGLVYALIFGAFLWIGNGLLAAHLRAEAVRVGENQLPALYASRFASASASPNRPPFTSSRPAARSTHSRPGTRAAASWWCSPTSSTPLDRTPRR